MPAAQLLDVASPAQALRRGESIRSQPLPALQLPQCPVHLELVVDVSRPEALLVQAIANPLDDGDGAPQGGDGTAKVALELESLGATKVGLPEELRLAEGFR